MAIDSRVQNSYMRQTSGINSKLQFESVNKQIGLRMLTTAIPAYDSLSRL